MEKGDQHARIERLVEAGQRACDEYFSTSQIGSRIEYAMHELKAALREEADELRARIERLTVERDEWKRLAKLAVTTQRAALAGGVDGAER